MKSSSDLKTRKLHVSEKRARALPRPPVQSQIGDARRLIDRIVKE